MKDIKNINNFIILILKCILIVLFLGGILPYIFDILIRMFIIKYEPARNSIMVFNVLSKNKIILWRFIYLVNQFFYL